MTTTAHHHMHDACRDNTSILYCNKDLWREAEFTNNNARSKPFWRNDGRLRRGASYVCLKKLMS
jgi:hypothetical protein